jgi:hypothetical protein
VSASRAAIKAATFTPLLTPLVASTIVPSIGSIDEQAFFVDVDGIVVFAIASRELPNQCGP